MASGPSPSSPGPLLPSVLKCAACRNTLQNVQPPKEDVDKLNTRGGATRGNKGLIPVVEEDSMPVPRWIQEKIDESGWTKGKISCPHCSARIGGFDFVGKGDFPIYLVRSKVDVHTPKDLQQLMTESRDANWPPRTAVTAVTDESEQGSSSDPSSAASSSFSEMTPSSSSSNDAVSGANNVPVSPEASVASNSSSWTDDDEDGTSDAAGASSSSSASEEMAIRRRLKERRLRRRKKLKKAKSADLGLNLKKRKATTEEQERVLNIINAEPELDNVDETLLCPVCLDILHEPFITIPCRHAFCEPCLRRLGSKNPMNTLCPMCRTRIAYCDLDREKTRLIKENYADLHSKRKKFERSTNVYNLPLPWRPGWRNLISGRAMGGNRFPDESYAAYIRRVLMQVPYYVPPVVIANLINLMLFIFLLGAVEIVPLFLGHITGKQYPIMSHLQPPINGGGGAAGDTEGSPSGQGAEPGSVEGSTARMSEIERLKEFARAVFPDETPEEMSLPPTSFPADSSEIPGLAWDATLYYVLGTLSLAVAAFGNILLIHQQPALGLLPAGLLERFYLRLGDFRRLRRLSDAAVILAVALLPLFLLPLVLPLPAAAESSWVRSIFQAAADVFLSAVGVVQSYITFTTLLVVGLAYWVGSVYLEYEEDGGVAA